MDATSEARGRHETVTDIGAAVNLPSFLLPHASESRAGGFALSTVLLAIPALVAGQARAGAILLAASAIAAAVFVERRTHSPSRSRALPARTLSVVPSARPARPMPRARWEVVERDGQRSLSMRWS
jgi:hypothetical protein